MSDVADLLMQLNSAIDARLGAAQENALAMQSEALEVKELRIAVQRKVEELERAHNTAVQSAARIAAEYERLAAMHERAVAAVALTPPPSPVAPKRAVQALKHAPQLVAHLDAASGPVAEFKILSGIYFLLHKKEVVYVGQSVSIMHRVQQHVVDGAKRFDRWCYIPVKQGELTEVERFYITLLRPTYNKAGKPDLPANDEVVAEAA